MAAVERARQKRRPSGPKSGIALSLQEWHLGSGPRLNNSHASPPTLVLVDTSINPLTLSHNQMRPLAGLSIPPAPPSKKRSCQATGQQEREEARPVFFFSVIYFLISVLPVQGLARTTGTTQQAS